MPTLYLIRHGQASFGTDNYDRLSPLGHRQCELAGSHLNNLGLRFDAVYCGRLARQQSSAQALAKGYGDHAEALPAPRVDNAFDEYNADNIFKAYLPRVLAEDSELSSMESSIYADRELFQKAFSRVMDAWVRGEPHEQGDLESWTDFLERVESGLRRVVSEQERTANVVAVTSGGPIAIAVMSALGMPDGQAMRLNYGIYNASITRLRVGRSSRRLMGFNDIAHLELEKESGLVSFR